MRRPLVLATTLAAELAAGTLALAPPAAAQTLPDAPVDAHAVASDALDPGPGEPGPGDPGPVAEPPSDDPGDPGDPGPAPVRTGRVDPTPDDAPVEQPDLAPAVPTTVRTGRLDDAAVAAAAQTRGDRPTRGDAADETVPSTAPRGPRRTGPTNPSSTGPAAEAVAPPAASPTAAPSVSQTSHVVVPGDHLWAIAAQQVASASGRAPGDLAAADVVTYWVQLCMQNRPQLRSGNPSLIYPGEVVALPPVG